MQKKVFNKANASVRVEVDVPAFLLPFETCPSLAILLKEIGGLDMVKIPLFGLVLEILLELFTKFNDLRGLENLRE